MTNTWASPTPEAEAKTPKLRETQNDSEHISIEHNRTLPRSDRNIPAQERKHPEKNTDRSTREALGQPQRKT